MPIDPLLNPITGPYMLKQESDKFYERAASVVEYMHEIDFTAGVLYFAEHDLKTSIFFHHMYILEKYCK